MTSLEKRGKIPQARKELRYPLGSRKNSSTEDGLQAGDIEVRKESVDRKKRLNSVNSIGKGETRRRSEVERSMDKNADSADSPETWSKVVGRKDRRKIGWRK